MTSMTHPFRALGHLCDQRWSVLTYKWGPATEKSVTSWTWRLFEMNYRLASYSTTWVVANFDFHKGIKTKNKKTKNIQSREERYAPRIQLPWRVQKSHVFLWYHKDLTMCFSKFTVMVCNRQQNIHKLLRDDARNVEKERHLVIHIINQQIFQNSFCS